MSVFQHGDVSIHFDEGGDGFPVLLIAPGGMRSAAELWSNAPWDPRSLADDYRVIALDQRNAGRSTAPVTADDDWATYTADQLGVLDHLGVERCHVVGMCIGGPYIMGLLDTAPDRFASAVLLQPVGIDDNREAFYEMFDTWAESIRDRHPEADAHDWTSFRSNMWDGEFVLTVMPEQAAHCDTPMLVMMGNDLYHPQTVSRELASVAPHATLVEEWKEGDALVAAIPAIRSFLADHTP